MRILKTEKSFLQSNHKKQTINPLHSARYNNPNLTHKLEIDRIIELRSLSVHIKRLRWNDLLKKRFWRKYKLIRPCISQVSRQLLNYELKKKKSLLINGITNSIKSNKSSVLTDKAPIIDKLQLQNNHCQPIIKSIEMKRKSCEVSSLGNAPNKAICAIESPIKKMKQKDTETDSEGNFFVGFESSSSPSRALIKLKTVNLKNFRTPSLLPKASVSIVTKEGVHSIKTKTVVLSNSKFPLVNPSKLENSDESNVQSEAKSSSLENTSKVDETFKSDSISCASFGIITEELNKHEPDRPNINASNFESLKDGVSPVNSLESETTTLKEIIPISASTAVNGDISKKQTDLNTIVNCVARKKTYKFKLKKYKTTNSNLINSLTNRQDCKDKNANLESKFNNSCYKTASFSEPVKYKSDSSTDSASAKHDSSDDDNNEIEPFEYLKEPINDLTTSKLQSSRKNFNEFSDSDTTTDSLDVSSSDLCSSSSDEESEVESRPYVEMDKYLACQIDAFNTENGDVDGANCITYTCQNDQLNCESQVQVRLLTATDITDKFCLKYRITGICGFKLKQLLCTLKHEPRNGYDSSAPPENEEEEEEETIKTPHFLTVSDPLTHSLFSLLIRRDRKEKRSSNIKLFEVINRALFHIDPSAVIRRSSNQINHIDPPHNTNKPKIFVRKESTLTGSVGPMSSFPQNVYSPVTNYSTVTNYSPVTSGSRMMLTYVPPPNSVNPMVSSNLMSGGNFILVPHGMGQGGKFLLPRPQPVVGVSDAATQSTVYPTSTLNLTSTVNPTSTANPTITQGFSLAPPPLTPCSNLGRFAGQGPFSISQPPQLKRMNNLTSTPTIDLTDEPPTQQPVSGPQVFRQSNAFGTNYLTYNEDTTAICPNNPLTVQKLNEKLFKIIEVLKAFLCIGFERNDNCIHNAFFQMLYSDNEICCKHHAIAAVNRFGVMHRLSLSPYYRQTNFFELPLPQPPITEGYPATLMPNHDMFAIKRFVFAVDKTTRAVLFPLPPYCIPKENDMVDKITVVFFISPRRGMGPGLIVFPHSILQRKLLLSLESPSANSPLGKDWVISAHQRGGLTQSMLTEFLDEATPWVNKSLFGTSPVLVVDWWWCVDNDSLNPTFKALNQVQLQMMYARNKDPLEICLGVALDRMWSHLVRKFSSTIGTLKEDNFPKFIIQVLKDLCSPPRLTAWCKSSGLYPVNSTKANLFSRSFEKFC